MTCPSFCRDWKRQMPRKTLRTREELDSILALGGLELAEPYDSDKSYPKNAWVLTRCKHCGTVAHYRLKYVMDKASKHECVCQACFWSRWVKANPYYEKGSQCRDEDSARRYVGGYGFDLVQLLVPGFGHDAVVLVRCQACGGQSALCEKDVHFGCSCQSHPDTSAHYAPPITRKVKTPKYDEPVRRSIMSISQARVTPVSEVPELMAAWADERDPKATMVWPSGWHGMCPGDGQYRFKCKNGHHPYAFPYTYLKNGCPSCRANATKGTGLFLADTSPELAAEWFRARNGRWTPENVRQDSKRRVWWKCLACGHEWEATPRERSKRDGQLCPVCGKIQGSIGWVYPRIASEWDASNAISLWQVRPHARLSFTPLWDCPNNPDHKYHATVSSRVAGAECPECVDSGKSRVEMRYFEAARKAFGQARSGARYADEHFSHDWSIDISIVYRGKPVGIEYDGAFWHADKADIDERKSRELLAAGFIVIRLREKGLINLPIDDSHYKEIVVNPVEKDIDHVMRYAAVLVDAMV